MRNDDLRDLAEEFEASGLDEHSKATAQEILRRFAALRGMSCFDRDEQIAFIQHLRMNRERHSVIRDRLMIKFGVSKTTAYARITEALQLSGKLPVFRTGVESNEDNGKSGR